MPSFRETFLPALEKRGFRLETALFFCTVCVFFFFLPLRTDSTVPILGMTLCALPALKRTGGFSRLLTGGAKIPLLAFIFFIGIALAASLLNPPVLSEFPRILLWGCCAFSGAALSICVRGHDSRYFWALFAGIAGSFLAALLIFGYDAPRLWQEERLKLFAIHPSRLGLYCSACLFFLLYRAAASSGKERILAAGGVLLVFFLLVKTNTRGNLLMVPLGLVFLCAVLPRPYLKRVALAFFLCALLGAGTLWLNGTGESSRRFTGAVAHPLEERTFKTRLPIWEAGWESFKDAPLIGRGYKSYPALHAEYLARHRADWDRRYGGRGYERSVKQAHNLILGRLVETGLLGTAAFLIFFIGAARAVWRGPPEARWLPALLVFYLGMNMFDDGLFRMNDAFILFVAGTALGYSAKPAPMIDG